MVLHNLIVIYTSNFNELIVKLNELAVKLQRDR